MTPRARVVLGIAAAIHFIHDGFSDMLFVLFPVWAADVGLSLAQVGLLKAAYSGGMAAFQVPAGVVAERWGERRLLAAGTVVTGLGFLAAGFAGGFLALFLCLLAAGLGSGVQHPLASSLVARAYEVGPRRTALGTYNFAGDLGKAVVPATVALVLPWAGWRAAAQGYAAAGLVAGAVIPALLARLGVGGGGRTSPAETVDPPHGGWGIHDVRGYAAVSALYVIDNGTRAAFLTFLPFLLVAKGASVPTVGLALLLVFVGGAAGKLACGILAERVGVIRAVVGTEAATGLGILALLGLPLWACLVALPVLGTALNGTSSVLLGTVADLVASDRRSRSYAIYYTLGISTSALAPSAYGVLGDRVGVALTLAVIGTVVFATIPLSFALRRPLRRMSGLAEF